MPAAPPPAAWTTLAPTYAVAVFDEELCIRCEDCIDVCPDRALSMEDERVVVDSGRCSGCGACAAVCPTGALTLNDAEPSAAHGSAG